MDVFAEKIKFSDKSIPMESVDLTCGNDGGNRVSLHRFNGPECRSADVVSGYKNTGSCKAMGKSDFGESLVIDELSSPTKYEELSTTVTNSNSNMLYRFVNNLFFRLVTLFLILADCIITVVDLSIEEKSDHLQSAFDIVAITFVLIFLAEISLRIYATGKDQFFVDWYNCVDFVVIAMSFLVTSIYIFINSKSYAKLIVLARLIRAMVLIRFIRVVITEPKNIQKGVRHVVSENKRRYRGDGFDLDLTYITPRVIGMSFPSTGSWAFYRNNIKDVARFFNTKHGIDHYKIYNLCAEKSYDPTFFQGRVASFPIDDHNVPSIEQMMEFVKDVREWLEQDERNIIAVHCKGGKGRTGTMICAWLIYNGHFEEYSEVLNYFAERRTDLTIGKKYQGVETPSQARYVCYFNKVINELGGKIPEKRQINLKSIAIEGIAKIGAGNGSDFSCNIVIDRDEVFNLDFGTETNCTAFYNREEDILIVNPLNCPVLRGNIRVKFNSRSKSVPKAYENCAFYFWFNTSFVDSNSLTLRREELDNPHKPKTWKLYTERFRVTLCFTSPTSSPSSSSSSQ